MDEIGGRLIFKEVNDWKTEIQQEKLTKKGWLFESFNKIINPLTRLKKKKTLQINSNRSNRRGIRLDLSDLENTDLKNSELSCVVGTHTFNHNPWETAAGRSQLQDSQGYIEKFLLKNQKKNQHDANATEMKQTDTL